MTVEQLALEVDVDESPDALLRSAVATAQRVPTRDPVEVT